MLYNKNNVRKTNDKKILHKVGKQWKVVSVALLMAIGGGAVATHVANAQSNNATVDNNPIAVQSAEPVKPASANNNKSASASTSASASSVAPSSFAPGDAGSAASYHAKDMNDNNVIENYVSSLNAKFPTAVNMANAMTASAKSAENSDNAMAEHYSAVAKSNVNSPAVKSLASKSGLTPSDYANVVAVDADNYNANVKNASAFENAFNMVSSLANNLVMNNWSSAANVAASKANDLYAKSQVASDTYNAFSSASASASSSASTASSTNSSALSEATSASIEASVATDVAKGLVGTAVNGINDVAKNLNVNAADVNSVVNSVVSSEAALSHKPASGTYNITYSANGKSANSAEMSFAISNTYKMSSAASVTASANSTIASAKAHSAVYSANVVSANAASVKASKVNSAASDAYLVAKIASAATSTVNANMTSNSASDAAFIQKLANAYHNGGRASLASQLNINTNEMDTVESNNDDKLMLASMASAEGVNVLALKNNASAVKSVLSAGSAAVSSASTSNKGSALNLSNLQSLANSMSASASTVTANAQSASASYASANDTDVTLASYYASSYANDASNEASSVSTIAAGLATVGNSLGLNTSAYNSAVADKSNASALAVEYAKHAQLLAPKFITITKDGLLHKSYNYGDANDAKLAHVLAGQQYNVLGYRIDANGNLRYQIQVGNQTGYFTSNPGYVVSTYAFAKAGNKSTVNVNNDVRAFSDVNRTKATGDIVKKGTSLNVIAVAAGADNYYGGYSVYEIMDGKYAGDFITSNVKSVSVPQAKANNNNNNNNNNNAKPAQGEMPSINF